LIEPAIDENPRSRGNVVASLHARCFHELRFSAQGGGSWAFVLWQVKKYQRIPTSAMLRANAREDGGKKKRGLLDSL